MVRRMSSLRMLWDIEARVAMLRESFSDVRQVLTLSLPPPELLGGPDVSPEFARVANDGMAEMCAKWPDEFPAFIASLPMNNVPAALEEMDRAIGEARRARHAGVHQRRGAAARRPGIPAGAGARDEPARSSGLDAPGAPGNARRLSERAAGPSTRSGRCWDGRSKAASRWRAWCSRDCSTGCRGCASSRITAAA